MAQENQKCAHPGCNCTATAAGEYCSENCQHASEKGEGECNCGHSGCG